MDGVANARKIKAIFTDLDNTLWNGILAEQQAVSLRKDYYNFLKEMHNKGILLFVVSQNDKKDVKGAFQQLDVDETLFTAVVANWDPKYLNVEKLIRTCELRPETVIFVDDNVFERNEAKTKIPAVYCIDQNEWPEVIKNKYVKKAKVQSVSEINTRINRYKTAIAAQENRGKFKEDAKF